jgi:hypothetical protein
MYIPTTTGGHMSYTHETRMLTITRIDVQEDRILLYGDDPYYHLIASLSNAPELWVGKKIAYAPDGVNFGWYISTPKDDA